MPLKSSISAAASDGCEAGTEKSVAAIGAKPTCGLPVGGGTFGVAAIGALFQHLASSRLQDLLAGTGVSAAQRDQIVHSLGSGGGPAGADPQVAAAAKEAFIHALSSGMWLSAGVAFTGAIIALVFIAPKTTKLPDPARAPEATAEAVGV
jgi:hypothetical protein